MAICGNCGNDFDDSLKICPKCGARDTKDRVSGFGLREGTIAKAKIQ
jgi:hypothetical protein